VTVNSKYSKEIKQLEPNEERCNCIHISFYLQEFFFSLDRGKERNENSSKNHNNRNKVDVVPDAREITPH
jgi:hypothetical protein